MNFLKFRYGYKQLIARTNCCIFTSQFSQNQNQDMQRISLSYVCFHHKHCFHLLSSHWLYLWNNGLESAVKLNKTFTWNICIPFFINRASRVLVEKSSFAPKSWNPTSLSPAMPCLEKQVWCIYREDFSWGNLKGIWSHDSIDIKIDCQIYNYRSQNIFTTLHTSSTR